MSSRPTSCRVRLAGLAAATLIALVPVGAQAQDNRAQEKWPARRITLIVPFGPGTTTDANGRLFAEELKGLLGQPLIVENRAGAGSTLGAHAVAKAAPDGYTLLIGGNSSHTAAPALIKVVPYDPIKDFTPIARIGKYPSVVATNPQQPFKTIQELVAYARANPGKLTYGHGNSTGQITGETIKKRLQLDIARLPYTSNPPALTDLLGNSIQLMVPDFLTGLPNIEARKIVPLAVIMLERSASLPNVPTLAETVMPGFEVLPWVGLFGPAGLPPDIVKTVADAVATIMARPDIERRLHATGTEPFYASSAEFAAFVKADLPKWIGAGKEAGIEPQ